MEVHLVKQNEIDKIKWDECISRSPNGLIYAESIYLDEMAPGWFGIVAGNYKAVMPVCHRSKLGVQYLYQPAFCQQGGIFFTHGELKDFEPAFLNILKSKFRFAEISINFAHQDSATFDKLKKCSNFIRDLSTETYTDYINTRLQRLEKFKLQYRSAENTDSLILAYQKLYAQRITSLTQNDFDNFCRLCKKLNETGRVIMREVWDNDETQLMASCLLLTDEKRIYNIINNVFAKGRQKLANYFLFQQIFFEFKHSGKIFDFEGSDLIGVGYFYEKFSTTNQPYFKYRYNQLPGFIKWIKG